MIPIIFGGAFEFCPRQNQIKGARGTLLASNVYSYYLYHAVCHRQATSYLIYRSIATGSNSGLLKAIIIITST